MPKEGFKAITVPENVWADLKARAEELDLSLPQLIQTHMRDAHSLNDIQWVNQAGEVETYQTSRINAIYTLYIRHFHKKRAEKLRRAFKPQTSLSYEENRDLEKEARAFAEEVAGVVLEKDKETFEEWKKLTEERRLKDWLARPSDQVKSFELNPVTKVLEKGNVTYKTNAEAITDKLTQIHDGLEAHKDNVIEVSKLVVEWDKLRKYMPYLSDDSKELDRSIAETLGLE